jgi:hypothetical protein
MQKMCWSLWLENGCNSRSPTIKKHTNNFWENRPKNNKVNSLGRTLTGQETLAQATPWLGQIKVSDALAANPQLRNLLPANAFGRGQIKSSVANLPFGSIVDLTTTKLDRVPSLANTAINKFQGYQKLMTNMIPNVGNIAIANMPKVNIPAGMAILKMDAVRTKERNVRHMVMSGSDLETSKECLTNCQ